MKKIAYNEEFNMEGTVFIFTKSAAGETTLKVVRKSKGKPSFVPPTTEEVKEFFKSKGYTEESAAIFHEYYELGNWKDSKGNQVKNWRQKAASVWFRDDNKPKQQEGIKFFQ